ncbi:hypothetical protein VTJ04DRAFT_2776 [Mycothermus thermophilus]|uniref:uncharacterized protein n=1 Tax=Humicola insolens TaxID=85995 RepID=UPI00374420C3
MADRHPSSRPFPAGTNRARSGIPSTSTQSVRRNLFPSHLTRRQPAVSPPPEDAPHFEASSQHQHHLRHNNNHFASASTPSPSDIVVRDHNGEIELGDPPSPLVDDAEEDPEAAEARHESEMERQRLAEAVRQHRMGQHGVPAHPEGKDKHDSSHYRSIFPNTTTITTTSTPSSPVSISSNISSSSSSGSNGSECSIRLHLDYLTKTMDPPDTELLEAVKASLRAKVAALEEDRWLYEPDPPQRLHQ